MKSQKLCSFTSDVYFFLQAKSKEEAINSEAQSQTVRDLCAGL